MSKQMKSKKQVVVPRLRFPEFRKAGEWDIVPLKKLANRRTDRNRDGKLTRVLTNSAEHGVVDQRDYFDKDIATQGNLENYFIVEKDDFVYNPRVSASAPVRSEEHTSELQSRGHLVCRLLLEKKKHNRTQHRRGFEERMGCRTDGICR